MRDRYRVQRERFRTAGNCEALIAPHCDGSILAGEMGGWVDGEAACGACTEKAELTNEMLDEREGNGDG